MLTAVRHMRLGKASSDEYATLAESRAKRKDAKNPKNKGEGQRPITH